MGAVKSILKRVSKVFRPPSVAAPEPPPPPAPAPAVEPVSTPKPTPVAAAVPVATPDPVVSDPVPVTAEPMETQETAQDLQRLKTKKKGRKPLIATSAQGLGGEAPTYTPTLLG